MHEFTSAHVYVRIIKRVHVVACVYACARSCRRTYAHMHMHVHIIHAWLPCVSCVRETERERKRKQHCLTCFSPLNKTLQNLLPLPGKTVQPRLFLGFALRACGSHCTCPAAQPPCERSAAASYCQCQGCPLLTDHKVTGVRSSQRFYSLQEFWGVQGISTILWLYNYYFWGF